MPDNLVLASGPAKLPALLGATRSLIRLRRLPPAGRTEHPGEGEDDPIKPCHPFFFPPKHREDEFATPDTHTVLQKRCVPKRNGEGCRTVELHTKQCIRTQIHVQSAAPTFLTLARDPPRRPRCSLKRSRADRSQGSETRRASFSNGQIYPPPEDAPRWAREASRGTRVMETESPTMFRPQCYSPIETGPCEAFRSKTVDTTLAMVYRC